MVEKRQYLRIPLSVPVEFRRTGYTGLEKNLSEDLSIQGVRFLSHKLVPVKSYIKVEMKTNDADRQMAFIAKVAWVKSIYDDQLFEIGAKIWEISNESSAFLQGLLKL
jgi:hypothetical protein